MARFCRNCGTEVNENQNVCLNCGTILKSQQAPVVEDDDKTPMTVGQYIGYSFLFAIPFFGLFFVIYTAISNKNKNMKNFAIAQIVMMAVALVLMVLYIVFIISIIGEGMNIGDISGSGI